jgi:hypothetical protein
MDSLKIFIIIIIRRIGNKNFIYQILSVSYNIDKNSRFL